MRLLSFNSQMPTTPLPCTQCSASLQFHQHICCLLELNNTNFCWFVSILKSLFSELLIPPPPPPPPTKKTHKDHRRRRDTALKAVSYCLLLTDLHVQPVRMHAPQLTKDSPPETNSHKLWGVYSHTQCIQLVLAQAVLFLLLHWKKRGSSFSMVMMLHSAANGTRETALSGDSCSV